MNSVSSVMRWDDDAPMQNSWGCYQVLTCKGTGASRVLAVLLDEKFPGGHAAQGLGEFHFKI